MDNESGFMGLIIECSLVGGVIGLVVAVGVIVALFY